MAPTRSLPEMPQWTHCVKPVSSCETPTELQPVAKEVGARLSKEPLRMPSDNVVIRNSKSPEPHSQINNGKVMEEEEALEKLSEELLGIKKMLSHILDEQGEETKAGYWTRVAKRVNKAFFIFYVTVVAVFLIVIYLKWNDVLD